ncbi:MAG: hypothetical protein M1542_01480 [Thermotogae bacterium]|nr:hypothetical protein [Thermotogota bacterium]MCL5031908.1 hypothetical protein [Thermotogota bacterium]
MDVIYYPEELREENSSVKAYIESLKEDHPEIYKKTQLLLIKVKDSGIKAIEDLREQGVCKSVGKGIHEFRIPPHGKGGVLRIYFTFHPFKKNTILILDAEFKKRDKADLKETKKRRKKYE